MQTMCKQVIKPGNFGAVVAADTRRLEFDTKNESLIATGTRPDVIFIGDSITHIWELQAYFGGTGRIIINRGICGDVSTYLRARYEADALQLDPRLIVMLIGTNDLGWSQEGLDDTNIDKLVENVSDMAVQTHQAGITLALCSILPIWGPSWYPVPDFIVRKNAQIVEANSRIRSIAGDTRSIYVDYHSQMSEPNGMLVHELAEDGIHPVSAGYTIMAGTLRKAISDWDKSLTSYTI